MFKKASKNDSDSNRERFGDKFWNQMEPDSGVALHVVLSIVGFMLMLISVVMGQMQLPADHPTSAWIPLIATFLAGLGGVMVTYVFQDAILKKDKHQQNTSEVKYKQTTAEAMCQLGCHIYTVLLSLRKRLKGLKKRLRGLKKRLEGVEDLHDINLWLNQIEEGIAVAIDIVKVELKKHNADEVSERLKGLSVQDIDRWENESDSAKNAKDKSGESGTASVKDIFDSNEKEDRD